MAGYRFTVLFESDTFDKDDNYNGSLQYMEKGKENYCAGLVSEKLPKRLDTDCVMYWRKD